MKKKIKVVGAIIENTHGEVLCALRSPKMSLPNLWEFPGGKVEENEGLNEAIEREIREELGCKVKAFDVFNDNVHEYDKFIVNLITIKCKLVHGIPVATEHATLLWLPKECLHSLVWAPADVPAVDQLMSEKRH